MNLKNKIFLFETDKKKKILSNKNIAKILQEKYGTVIDGLIFEICDEEEGYIATFSNRNGNGTPKNRPSRKFKKLSDAMTYFEEQLLSHGIDASIEIYVSPIIVGYDRELKYIDMRYGEMDMVLSMKTDDFGNILGFYVRFFGKFNIFDYICIVNHTKYESTIHEIPTRVSEIMSDLLKFKIFLKIEIKNIL